MPYWRLNYHLVWSTKYREPAMVGALPDAVQRAIWTSAKKLKLQVHALNVQPDHVHLAFSAPPKYAPSDLARLLKGSSSHFLGREFEGFWPGWQSEFGVVGFGGQSMARIVAYITDQDEHHRENRLWLELEKGMDEPLPVTTPISPSGTSDA